MLEKVSGLAQILAKTAREAVRMATGTAREAVHLATETAREAARVLKPAVKQAARDSFREVVRIPQGRLTLSILEHEGPEGKARNFWILERRTTQGTRRIARGRLADIRDTDKLFREAASALRDERRR